MNLESAWEKAAAAEGTTESERILTRLARKAFLSLWSYPNVFSDEGRSNGKGDGKELVDLLVVFGNNVLLFSDKHCEFQLDTDIKVAWPRWYKRAIAKSVRQLSGAESFLRRFPGRVFINKDCQTPLPISLPEGSEARYFLIAVTRGAHQATAKFYGGGSSGSLMLSNWLEGDAHLEAPFQVGFPLKEKRFAHVLDEMTIEALLEELDTVPDLISYLQCKEKYFGAPDMRMQIAGEEELLAQYMCTMERGRHALPKIPAGTDAVTLLEGDWEFYGKSPQRAAKRKADEDSYVWDALIEYQASFIRAGTAIGNFLDPDEPTNHERVLRALANETRLSRRELVGHLKHALKQSEPGKKFARMVLSGDNMQRAYVFLTAPRPADESYEQYREHRTAALLTYCHGLKMRFPFATEAIGIASEPFSEEVSSQDFLYVNLDVQMDNEEQAHWQAMMEDLDVMQTPASEIKLFGTRQHEFPIPFEFGGTKFYENPTANPMNRAERRKMERNARKHAKRKP